MEERLRREIEFHDARFAEGAKERSADRFYAVTESSNNVFRAAIAALPPGSDVLDFGCGDGAYVAIEAAQRGHNVTAFDLSPIAIEQAERKAVVAEVAGRIDFQVLNAEALELDRDAFDMVCGVGVLHHLQLAPALGEVARVLRPTGSAVFIEPMGHNPIFNLYRNRTPDQRSEDEHPLLRRDLDLLHNHFDGVELDFFHLLDLAALPFRGRKSFDAILRRLAAFDRWLLRTPVRSWAWIVAMTLSKPRR